MGVQVGSQKYGICNADYGPGFASAQWRQGMSKLLTAQAGIDLSRKRQNVCLRGELCSSFFRL